MIRTLFNSFIALISLMTATGVFMHDCRIDKMAVTRLSQTKVTTYHSSGPDDIASRIQNTMSIDSHTHPDHNAGRSLLHGFTSNSPSIAPNSHQNRRSTRVFEPVHRHAFDDVYMPVLT